MHKPPKQLLDALRGNELVIFAGAGVSKGNPANLPLFSELVNEIAQGTGQKKKDNESEDRFLGRLGESGVKVHARTKEILTAGSPEPTELHRDLLRLYLGANSARIVTTNFDRLFEDAVTDVFDSNPEIFRAPALPLGREFNGIVHLHGSLDLPDEMILTDADFGRAYLIDGWAPRFLIEMFRSFTVLFVGYRHDDTVMHYLTRALPISQTKRFILTDEAKSDRWTILGIEPIPWQSPPELYKYVHNLANHVQRGILDWKREIAELLKKPPSLDENQVILVEETLLDEEKVHFFTNTTPAIEWLDWLDKRNHLDALFQRGEFGELDKRNQQLAGWVAWKFACSHPDELFRLIGRHNVKIHPYFWFELSRVIGLEREVLLDDKSLMRWVSLLLAAAPSGQNIEVLSWLGERCTKANLVGSLLEIFDAMSIGLMIHAPIEGWPSATSDGRYEINKLWKEGLKPNLNFIAESLLDSATKHLADRHRMLITWRDGDHYGDWESHDRSAIEPHEQDEYPECVDVLIDVVRDCLAWLIPSNPRAVERWGDRFIHADAPLLRRVAIYVLPKRTDLTPDEKINWLLDNTDIHELLIHHEIFWTMRQIYESASLERRQAVIHAILAYHHPNQEDEEKKRTTAYQHFAWLHWLHEAVPDCASTMEALEKVRGQYPDFRASDHPDFFIWTETSFESDRQSPWSVKELLSQPGKKWIQELLSFQETYFEGPSRDGLLRAVQEAAGQEFDWGLALADALVTEQEWDSDLWGALMDTWRKISVDENAGQGILQKLQEIELHKKYARSIAETLRGLIKNGNKSCSLGFLQQVNTVAKDLWDNLDQNQPCEEIRDWFTSAINHPVGILAQFWLESLSMWRGQQDPKPTIFNDEYREAFTVIIQNKTTTGKLGRAVLANQFSFLLTSDEIWTQENLLPLFSGRADIDEYRAVWDGFLYGSVSAAVANLMEDAFLEAALRIEDDLSEEIRCNRFVEKYTIMLTYFVERPSDLWIPQLLQHADDRTQYYFTRELGFRLGRMRDSQKKECWNRWLKNYWENRVQGVPKPISAGESEEMLQWLLDLEIVFPEAVELAVRMPPLVQLQKGTIVFMLNDGNLWKNYPGEVTKLLIYLGKNPLPDYVWYRGKELIQKLLSSDLAVELKTKLEELAALRGLG